MASGLPTRQPVQTTPPLHGRHSPTQLLWALAVVAWAAGAGIADASFLSGPHSAGVLVTVLVASAVGSAIQEPVKVQPRIKEPLENITVAQGRDVQFTCTVENLGGYKVAWLKSDSKAILALNTHRVAQNPRLAVTHNGHDTWRLNVANVQHFDSGTYMCQINTEPMTSMNGHLTVNVPPDILNEDGDSSVGKNGGVTNVAREGESIKLKCTATGVPEPKVSWKREGGHKIVFRNEKGSEKLAVKEYEGSVLYLTNVQRQDMGAYLCIASNRVPPSVSKRFWVGVHFKPLIKVSNQLVAAPAGSDVVIQCHVEASPRSLNTWWKIREKDRLEIMNSDKYSIEEVQLSEYSYLMNLTIRDLGPKDFGAYFCDSTNLHGQADEVVRLQELHLETTRPPPLPPPTTSPTTPRVGQTSPPRHGHDHKHRARKKPPTHSKDNADAKRKLPQDDPDDGNELIMAASSTPVPSPPFPLVTRSPQWRPNGAGQSSKIANPCFLFAAISVSAVLAATGTTLSTETGVRWL